jgi:uncharacterized CHY-type Zn-finger protein
MKYYVVHVSNGNLQIQSITEHGTPEAALVEYHNRCKTLWNAADVVKATVKILDEQLDCYQGYSEIITHAQAEAEEPAES